MAWTGGKFAPIMAMKEIAQIRHRNRVPDGALDRNAQHAGGNDLSAQSTGAKAPQQFDLVRP